MTNFESLEKVVRTKMLEQVSPKIAFFFIKQVTGTQKGRERVVKSIALEGHSHRKTSTNIGIETL